jgi:hypothetical protein
MFRYLLGPEPKREVQLQMPTQVLPNDAGTALLLSQIFSWVDPLFWLAEFSAADSAAFERCCPLALIKARSLPKWWPGLEIRYQYENK